jgi:NAD(P)-dependent dehydrogenase (short-subunit alcohol dehydrogenase family)
MPADTVSQFGGTSPMGRPAQPAELAPAFVFLASQEAGYVNGETLGVTGGQPLPSARLALRARSRLLAFLAHSRSGFRRREGSELPAA